MIMSCPQPFSQIVHGSCVQVTMAIRRSESSSLSDDSSDLSESVSALTLRRSKLIAHVQMYHRKLTIMQLRLARCDRRISIVKRRSVKGQSRAASPRIRGEVHQVTAGGLSSGQGGASVNDRVRDDSPVVRIVEHPMPLISARRSPSTSGPSTSPEREVKSTPIHKQERYKGVS